MSRIPSAAHWITIVLVLVVAVLLLPASQLSQAVSLAAPMADFQPLQGIVKIATGESHTCALTAIGGVKCWGGNTYGQLGNGNTVNSNTPMDVSSLNDGVNAISAGSFHTCALTTTGGVKCWGNNSYGKLGNGSTVNSNTPVDVNGLSSGVSAISAGGSFTCAVTTTGGVKCWGLNNSGQLGNGSTVNSNTPVDVSGLSSGAIAISAGSTHTCALTTAGGVKCWGDGYLGKLGNGNGSNRNIPVDVSGLSSGVSAISAGSFHTCALTTTGGVKCWGWDQNSHPGGTLNTRASTTPVAMSGLNSGISAITAGSWHTCVLTVSGGVKCWGFNYYGQLGNGSIAQSNMPVDVSGLSSGVSAITANSSYYSEHTCALTTMGSVKCWGDNSFGQLGNGNTTSSKVPVDVSGLTSGISAISAGSLHTCTLTVAQGVKCWGRIGLGLIGTDKTINSSTPIDVNGLSSGITAISAGGSYDLLYGIGYICVLTTTGGVKCSRDFSHTPVDVNGLSGGVSAISAGGTHTCALTTTGDVKCWLHNNNNLIDVSGLSSGVSAISAGGAHTCALTTTGGVKCWPNNNNTPVDVSGLNSGVSAISAGGTHTCALTTTGGIKCWGSNGYGQLGNNNNNYSSIPVDVSGLSSGVSTISAGRFHTCALTMTGRGKCWGDNSSGQLGNGSTTSSNTPVTVSRLSSGARAISAGGAHTCALTTTGGVKCWGDNSFGQLGDDNPWKTTPVDVLETVCYQLILNHSGNGSDPTASPTNSPGCANGQYIAGTVLSLSITPSAGWQVASWSGTDNDADSELTNSLVMLASNHTVSVTYSQILSTCYPLNVSHTGSGNDPIAIPAQSMGCSIGQYIAGQSITLTASPINGWQVASWNGTSNNTNTATNNSLTMPASNQNVSVNYSQIPPTCYQLNANHSGSGSNPMVTPAQSTGCTMGQYVAGQNITLNANPTSGWQVASWHGTDNDASTAVMNTLVMTTNNRTVNVVYEQLLPWVVLIYLNGDNNLDGATGKLFNQLEAAVAQDPSLMIRVLWDLADKGDTVLYQVQPDTQLYTFASYSDGINRWSKGELDMGDPQTLLDFILATRQDFPASQYRSWLSIVDHGGGWSPELPDPQKASSRYAAGSSGFSVDESNDYHYLSTQDLGEVFANPLLQSQPLDIVFYDACLMAIVEEAYQLRNSAHFFLASQYEAWATFPYSTYLNGLQTRSTHSQVHWIAAQYGASIQTSLLPHTLSVIDLQYTSVLSQAINSLAITLDQNLPNQKEAIYQAFLKTQKLDYDYDCLIRNTEGYVDLGDFAQKLIAALPGSDIQSAAQRVVEVLQGSRGPYINYQLSASGKVSTKNYCKASSFIDLRGVTGISIYLPLGEDDLDLPFYRGSQIAFAQATFWDEFIRNFRNEPQVQVPAFDYVGGRGNKPQPLSPPDTPVDTPSPTPTITPTLQATETPTPVDTPSPTPTITPISQATETPTPVDTPSPTPIITLTLTTTPTVQPTDIPTVTGTNTPPEPPQHMLYLPIVLRQ